MNFSFFSKSQKTENSNTETSVNTLDTSEVDRVIDKILAGSPDETKSETSTIDEAPKAKSKGRFRVIREFKGSKFMLDQENRISRVNWYGAVDQETAEIMLKLGGDSVEFQGYRKLILDRRRLKEFDTEARIWMKNFIKGRAKNIVGGVDKLAMVNRSSGSGSLFANFIGSAIRMVMPNLKIKKFASIYDAIDWAIED